MRETEQNLKFIFKDYLEFTEVESMIEQLRDEKADNELIVLLIDKIFNIYESMMPLLISFLKANKIF